MKKKIHGPSADHRQAAKSGFSSLRKPGRKSLAPTRGLSRGTRARLYTLWPAVPPSILCTRTSSPVTCGAISREQNRNNLWCARQWQVLQILWEILVIWRQLVSLMRMHTHSSESRLWLTITVHRTRFSGLGIPGAKESGRVTGVIAGQDGHKSWKTRSSSWMRTMVFSGFHSKTIISSSTSQPSVSSLLMHKLFIIPL